MTDPAPLALILPLLAILMYVAWTDLTVRRISNGAVLAVVALIPVELLLLGRPQPWWSGLAAGALVLTVGFLAWRAGLLGAGDAKLAAALGALVGLVDLLEFLLVTTIVGGLLAAAILLAQRLGPLLAGLVARLLPLPVAGRLAGYLLPDPAGPPASVPYGLALGAGTVWWILSLFGRS